MAPRVSVVPAALPVEALVIATCEVRVHNPGPEPDGFRFEVLGQAAQWAWFSPGTVTVPAGGDGAVRASFRLPRTPAPAAGPFPVQLKVTSVRRPEESTVAGLELEVAPFADLFVTIEPRQSQGGQGRHVVCVENRGNSAMPTRLRGEAPDATVSVTVDPPSVVALPGGSVTAAVTVEVAGRLGRADGATSFQVVAEPEVGVPQRVDGAFRHEVAGSRRPLALIALVVLVALVGAGALLAGNRSSDEEGTDRDDPDVEAAAVTPVNPACPAEGHLNRDRRATGNLPFSYSFLFSDPAGCHPVRFNPCQPIHYVTNDALAPPGALDDLREAFARITRATGMEFVHDGRTDEPTNYPNRPAYQPGRYGERWAPILVTWSKLGNEGRNDVIVLGRGNSVPVDGVLVTGQLDLNVDAVADQARTQPLANGFGEGATWGRVMLHELGHVFGLGHVESPSNLMKEELSEHTLRTAEFGIGDLQALRILGKEGGCVAVPAPRPVTGRG